MTHDDHLRQAVGLPGLHGPGSGHPDVTAWLVATAAADACGETLTGYELELALGRSPSLDAPGMVLDTSTPELMGVEGEVLGPSPDTPGLKRVRWTVRQVIDVSERLAEVLPELAARARRAMHPHEDDLTALKGVLERLGCPLSADLTPDDVARRLAEDLGLEAAHLDRISAEHAAGRLVLVAHPDHPRADVLPQATGAYCLPVLSMAGPPPPFVIVVIPPHPDDRPPGDPAGGHR